MKEVFTLQIVIAHLSPNFKREVILGDGTVGELLEKIANEYKVPEGERVTVVDIETNIELDEGTRLNAGQNVKVKSRPIVITLSNW